MVRLDITTIQGFFGPFRFELVVIFDDCQMPQVSPAVVSLGEWYQLEYVKAEPREYAIGRRR